MYSNPPPRVVVQQPPTRSTHTHTNTHTVIEETWCRDDDEDSRSCNEEHVGLSASVTLLQRFILLRLKKKISTDKYSQKFVNKLGCVSVCICVYVLLIVCACTHMYEAKAYFSTVYSNYPPIRSPSAIPQEQLKSLMISNNTAVKRPSSQ